MRPTSYILQIRQYRPATDELLAYLRTIAELCEVIVVDGSASDVFRNFRRRCSSSVRHVPPDVDTAGFLNGKVAGVMTGLRLATCERVVIADDDVRYDRSGLEAVSAALDYADVIRPQNYFKPLPWHARIDTARTLINRVSGGDWPGTLAVKRSMLLDIGGYDGNVMFENLELVRTVVAAGGRKANRPEIFVRRLPPSGRHYLSQRVRQAYDEFARPMRLLVWLSILPLAAIASSNTQAASVLIALPIVAAEAGRRVAGGTKVFAASSSLLAPVWLLERSISAWLALGIRMTRGGVPYHGRLVRVAATPMRVLRRRYGVARDPGTTDENKDWI